MFGSLASLPSVPLAPYPTPVEALPALRAALAPAPRLLAKRDDAIAFAFGGNKVRKMRLVAAEAVRAGADTLITSGGPQSNHARVTAAAAARLGMRSILVANGSAPDQPRANALLDSILGAEVRYVPTRDDRAAAMDAAAAEARAQGRHPFIIPLGASTPLGAAAFVQAVAELLQQIDPPDCIIHSTSSGGTQAGLVAGCALAGVRTRIIGISADEPSASLERTIRVILAGLAPLLGFPDGYFDGLAVEIDDTFVGGGYGQATEASREALILTARTEALFVDTTYTAKAMAGLISYVRGGRFREDETVLFWHTGGQVGIFA
jgi:1-aminocyclopropane-1-carboxylate deaminase/D-cysteine desulfhydrase-like pyridoxal-dependent ACC family enzyme